MELDRGDVADLAGAREQPRGDRVGREVLAAAVPQRDGPRAERGVGVGERHPLELDAARPPASEVGKATRIEDREPFGASRIDAASIAPYRAASSDSSTTRKCRSSDTKSSLVSSTWAPICSSWRTAAVVAEIKAKRRPGDEEKFILPVIETLLLWQRAEIAMAAGFRQHVEHLHMARCLTKR